MILICHYPELFLLKIHANYFIYLYESDAFYIKEKISYGDVYLLENWDNRLSVT